MAGSATTLSRRQAGPPPLAIDWRTSTTFSWRIGPLPAAICSSQAQTAGVSRDIRIVTFDSLLMDFAVREGASMIIRGLRAVADFEYEFQMAGMNQQLNADVETVFLMADVSLQPIASRLVKEIALYGGDVSRFVPPAVAELVRLRVEQLGRKGS